MTKSANALFELVKTLAAMGIALAVALVAVLFVSEQPWEALRWFLLGPLGSLRHFGNVIELMLPLTFTAVALCLMFQASQFNLAADGAFFAGGVASAAAAIKMALPAGLHPAMAIVFGGLAGMVVCLIPALLNLRLSANVLVSSLMLNYIVVYVGVFLLNRFLRDPYSGAMSSYPLHQNAQLPLLVSGTRIHAGLLLAIAVVLAAYVFLYRSKQGLGVRLAGENARFAGCAGVNTAAAVLLSQAAGGFIAGIGGAAEVLGMYRRFTWQNSPGYGWDGVVIALLAHNNPALVPPCALVLAYIRIGADVMALKTDVPSEIVFVIQAIMLLFVAANTFLQKYRQKLVERASAREVAI